MTRAIELVDRSVLAVLDGMRGRCLVEVVAGPAAMWRTALVRSDLRFRLRGRGGHGRGGR